MGAGSRGVGVGANGRLEVDSAADGRRGRKGGCGANGGLDADDEKRTGKENCTTNGRLDADLADDEGNDEATPLKIPPKRLLYFFEVERGQHVRMEQENVRLKNTLAFMQQQKTTDALYDQDALARLARPPRARPARHLVRGPPNQRKRKPPDPLSHPHPKRQ